MLILRISIGGCCPLGSGFGEAGLATTAPLPLLGAESATLAKSAVAYNAGTLSRGREAGVQWMRVFDGAGCG